MKKYRKQSVIVHGQKQFVDVPVDEELYKADNREEYQRARSKSKHVSLNDAIFPGHTADVAAAYEKKQLIECLLEALLTLSEKERRLLECIYYDGLTEQKTAEILNMKQQNVNRDKHKAIKKLRIILKDWID